MKRSWDMLHSRVSQVIGRTLTLSISCSDVDEDVCSDGDASSCSCSCSCSFAPLVASARGGLQNHISARGEIEK
jgi:hypothetical protein